MFKGINNQYDFKKSTQAMDQLVTDAHVIWLRTHLIHWIMQNDRTSLGIFGTPSLVILGTLSLVMYG